MYRLRQLLLTCGRKEITECKFNELGRPKKESESCGQEGETRKIKLFRKRTYFSHMREKIEKKRSEIKIAVKVW